MDADGVRQPIPEHMPRFLLVAKNGRQASLGMVQPINRHVILSSSHSELQASKKSKHGANTFMIWRHLLHLPWNSSHISVRYTTSADNVLQHWLLLYRYEAIYEGTLYPDTMHLKTQAKVRT